MLSGEFPDCFAHLEPIDPDPRRCVGLVKGRLRPAAGHMLVTLAAVGLYPAAVDGVMTLLLAPFGGRYTLPLPYGRSSTW